MPPPLGITVTEKQWTNHGIRAKVEAAREQAVADIDVIAAFPDIAVFQACANIDLGKPRVPEIATNLADHATVVLATELIEFESGQVEKAARLGGRSMDLMY